MSAKSWDEVEATTIVKSWSNLLKSSDESDKNSKDGGDDVDVESLLNDMDVPSEERTDSQLTKVILGIVNLQKRTSSRLQRRMMQ